MEKTIEEILSCRSCRELFPEDPAEAESVYRTLMKRFHPDVNRSPDAERAAAAVNALYRRIKTKPEMRTLELKTQNGNCRLEYVRKYDREDGAAYFGIGSVWYVLVSDIAPSAERKLLRRGAGFVTEMEKGVPERVIAQARSFLPEITGVWKMPDGGLILKEKTGEEELPLSEALEFFSPRLAPEHGAWIISRLLGMCCFAAVSGIVLDSLCTENLLIDPKAHTLRLSGGWWFSERLGEKLTGAQSAVFEAMPPSCRSDGIAREIIDLECVKALCREIFPKDSPQAALDYARSACMENAFEEMEVWERTISKAFGGRFFTPMPLCAADIFND